VAHGDGNIINNKPDNLRWASNAENQEDSRQHGTLPLGSQKWNAKLCEEQIPEIRNALKRGRTTREVAHIFGVTHTIIMGIKSGKLWRHVS
jgi:hypothetical protein